MAPSKRNVATTGVNNNGTKNSSSAKKKEVVHDFDGVEDVTKLTTKETSIIPRKLTNQVGCKLPTTSTTIKNHRLSAIRDKRRQSDQQQSSTRMSSSNLEIIALLDSDDDDDDESDDEKCNSDKNGTSRNKEMNRAKTSYCSDSKRGDKTAEQRRNHSRQSSTRSNSKHSSLSTTKVTAHQAIRTNGTNNFSDGDGVICIESSSNSSSSSSSNSSSSSSSSSSGDEDYYKLPVANSYRKKKSKENDGAISVMSSCNSSTVSVTAIPSTVTTRGENVRTDRKTMQERMKSDFQGNKEKKKKPIGEIDRQQCPENTLLKPPPPSSSIVVPRKRSPRSDPSNPLSTTIVPSVRNKIVNDSSISPKRRRSPFVAERSTTNTSAQQKPLFSGFPNNADNDEEEEKKDNCDDIETTTKKKKITNVEIAQLKQTTYHTKGMNNRAIVFSKETGKLEKMNLKRSFEAGMTNGAPLMLHNDNSEDTDSEMSISNKYEANAETNHVCQLENRQLSPTLFEIGTRPCCWTCLSQLRLPNNYKSKPTQQTSNEYNLFYTMHLHPILGTAVPLCAYCYENAEMVERDHKECLSGKKYQSHVDKIDQVNTEDEISTYCSGCGNEGEYSDDTVLLLCDNTNKCRRAFCKQCVVKANGGDDVGERVVHDLIMKSDESWYCPHCDPPLPLQQISQCIQQLKEDCETAAQKQEQQREQSSPGMNNTETSITNRSIDDVIEQLDIAEKELYDCQKQIDLFEMNDVEFREVVNNTSPDGADFSLVKQVEISRQEIRSEVMKSNPLCTQQSEEEIQSEFELLREHFLRHEVNVSNYISTLQEEIQIEHNLALDSVYRDGLRMMVPHGDGTHDDDDNDSVNEPLYVHAASKEISKRYKADGKSTFDALDQAAYLLDDYNEIEDLSTMIANDQDSQDHYESWVHCKTRPTPEQIQLAMETEDAKLAELCKNRSNHSRHEKQKQPVIIKIVDETQDEEETRQEQRYEVSSGGHRQSQLSHNIDRTPTGGKTTDVTNIKMKTLSAATGRTNGSLALKVQQVQKRRSYPLQWSNIPFSSPRQSERIQNDSGNEMHSYELSNRDNDIFKDSTIVLCREIDETNKSTDSSKTAVRAVAIASKLANQLKKHQENGIHFIWRNCFSDFAVEQNGNEDLIGGCILAHHMGLGKSLTTIALLHAVLRHPSMCCTYGQDTKRHLIRTVLLVAPVNTIANWESEFDKWLRDIDPLMVYNLGSCDRNSRPNTIFRWKRGGGVLLMSDATLGSMAKNKAQYQLLQPDVLVIDEAHTMLKTCTTEKFKALSGIRTRRKIALSGSPFQNNLLEYFRMVNFVRPGVLGFKKESMFEREYSGVIEKGLASDVSKQSRYNSLLKSKELSDKLRPYVDRVDESVLRHDLPLMQEVTLHIVQTSLQRTLYQEYNKRKKKNPLYNNFFRQYTALYPIHNHPGGLILDQDKNTVQTANDATETQVPDPSWWEPAVSKKGREKVLDVDHGCKIVVLLHILAYAQKLNEKVLIFSNCLKTLNYIEHVLALENWKDHVLSLRQAVEFSDIKIGGWRKSFEYLRIDGEIHSAERGDLVNQFNAADTIGSDSTIRAFLLSSRAGSVGINLQAASRVVLIDNHFNPTVMTQAVCRAYRYGQKKPVFCYRLLTKGAMEEKVYSRCVNKVGLGLQVIDQKTINRHFTARELDNLMETDSWVKCHLCQKFRLLIGDAKHADIPDVWECSLNNTDPLNNTCNASEKDEKWYNQKYFNSSAESDSLKTVSAQDETDIWVKCHQCHKRRLLIDDAKPSDVWECSLNNTDPLNNTCNASEKDKKWYALTYFNSRPEHASVETIPAQNNVEGANNENVLTSSNDEILGHLLLVRQKFKKDKVICDHFFQDVLLQAKHDELELEEARLTLQREQATGNAASVQNSCSVPTEDIGLLKLLEPSVTSPNSGKNDKEINPLPNHHLRKRTRSAKSCLVPKEASLHLDDGGRHVSDQDSVQAAPSEGTATTKPTIKTDCIIV